MDFDECLLEIRRESGGLRHYLQGEPVSAGTVLELLMSDGSWLSGRYEWGFRRDEPALFCKYVRVPGVDLDGYPNREQVCFALPKDALLRWPVR